MAGSTILGELSWDDAAKLLTVKGTIFIDGSIYIAPGGDRQVHGLATIVASGTFGMKGDTICATHPGYTGACDFTATSPWDPDKSALVIVADGAAGAGNAQGQGSDFNTGEGIELKSAGFQGALIANHTITERDDLADAGPDDQRLRRRLGRPEQRPDLPADHLRAVRRRRDHQRPAEADAPAAPELRGRLSDAATPPQPARRVLPMPSAWI